MLSRKVSTKTSELVKGTIISMLAEHKDKALVHTLTFDNGLEFARHVQID